MKSKHLFLLLPAVAIASVVFAQGPLTPTPGAPAPAMKTLLQVEPRTAIPALPFTISAPGSYYMTGNLTGVVGQSGITISADNVTIDLNGFTLTGVAGSNHGIATPAAQQNLAISNGTLHGWGGAGIAASSATKGRFERLQLSGNGASGLLAGATSIVMGCVSDGNGGHGIGTQITSTISGCAARSNGGAGILSPAGRVQVSDCAVEANGGAGIQLGMGAVVRDCTVRGNNTGGEAIGGIVAGSGSTLTNCSATANTGTAGISAGEGCTLTNCAADSNTVTFGIHVGKGSALQHCTARMNTSPAAVSGGVEAGNGCMLTDCAVVGNTNSNANNSATTGFGIRILTSSAVRDCTIDGNRGDAIRVIGDGCQVVGNTCRGVGGLGAGIHVLSNGCRIDSNHWVGLNGFVIEGVLNLVVRNSAQSYLLNISNYSIDAGNRDAARVMSPGASASPWGEFRLLISIEHPAAPRRGGSCFLMNLRRKHSLP